MQGQYAQISSRAFAEIGLFISLTRHLLAPGGRWLAMKGVRPDDELKALPVDITVDAIIPLTVPGLDAERHLIILKAGS
jgi:16S rRNA (guanine527-N7)-methyltransferase